MIVEFDIKDALQRQTVLNCLNVMNVKYKLQDEENQDLYYKFAMEVASLELEEYIKVCNYPIIQSMNDFQKKVIVGEIVHAIMENDTLINYQNVQDLVINMLIHEGYLGEDN